MLLVYPPAARSCEPPPGVARIAGWLRAHDVSLRTLDLCHEGYEYLLTQDVPAGDTWTQVALLNRQRNARQLRSPDGYVNADRYSRAVTDLNRALTRTAAGRGIVLTLSDYQDKNLSPLRRADLMAAASHFEQNLFYPFFRQRLGEALESHPAEVVGFSINFLSQALCAFAMVGYLRREYAGKKIVLGGGLVTSWIRQGRLSADENFGGLVDAVLPGRGEDSLLEYLGLPPRAGSAAPDFDDLMGNDYFSPARIIPYNFTTGCPWKRCRFCPEHAENTPYSGLNPDVAENEIAALVKKYSPGLLHFTDNEITPLYLKRLAANPPGAKWYGFARFCPELADPVFCRRLADSGCVLLQLGLESGDQQVLDALGKGTRLSEIDKVLFQLKSASIGTYLYVLFGTPAENRASALATRDFVESRSEAIDFMNVAIFNMPASGMEARSLKTQAFYEGDLSLYCDFEHPEGWNRGAVRAFLKNEFEPAPGIKKILRCNPPVFTSNHAAFFARMKR